MFQNTPQKHNPHVVDQNQMTTPSRQANNTATAQARSGTMMASSLPPSAATPLLSLQAALGLVVADLLHSPLTIIKGGVGNGAGAVVDESGHHAESIQSAAKARDFHSNNPFAPVSAIDGRVLTVTAANAVGAVEASGRGSVDAITAEGRQVGTVQPSIALPNPLLMQVLPPRLCANAVSIAVHGGEKIYRLVVVAPKRQANRDPCDVGYDSQQVFVHDRSSQQRLNNGDHRDDAVNGEGSSSSLSSSSFTVLRHMYQVGSHYNLYPRLYCSCHAFRYRCVGPNTHEALLHNNNTSGGTDHNILGGGYYFAGGGGSGGTGGGSSSMVCKHLAAVAALLDPSLAGEWLSSHRQPSEGGAKDNEDDAIPPPPPPAAVVPPLPAVVAALQFPKEKMVNINNPLANNNTQLLAPQQLARPHQILAASALGDEAAAPMDAALNGFPSLAHAYADAVSSGGVVLPAPQAATGGRRKAPNYSSSFFPQLIATIAANTANAAKISTMSEDSQSSSPTTRVLGVKIEDKVISAEEFTRIWGSELFK